MSVYLKSAPTFRRISELAALLIPGQVGNEGGLARPTRLRELKEIALLVTPTTCVLLLKKAITVQARKVSRSENVTQPGF